MLKADLKPRILYEDNHLIILNKLPSEIIQGDKSGDEPLGEYIKQYLKEAYNKPGNVYLGIVHRIDRPVSGAIVFAKTSKALTRMNELIKKRQFQKTYWAIVKNRPEQVEAELRNYLRRDQDKNKTFVYPNPVANSKEAILTYRLIASSDTYHLLEVYLVTGRHHQIRAQLANIGCPIKGDLKYGFDRSNKDGSISLHARSVGFTHPVKQMPVNVACDPPNEKLWNYFAEICG